MNIDPKLYQMLLETFKGELYEQHKMLISILLKLEEQEDDSETDNLLQEAFRISHNLKGAAKSVAIDDIAVMAHRLEDVFSKWRTDKKVSSKDELNACMEVADNCLIAFKLHSDGADIDLDELLSPLNQKKPRNKNVRIDNGARGDDFIKTPLARIEKVHAKANEFVTYRLRLMNWLLAFQEIYSDLDGKSNKVSEKLLSKFSNNLSEANKLINDFSRSLQALQDDVQLLRLVSVSHLLIPLERTIRDLSVNLKKPVKLTSEGGNIQVDKKIIDNLHDPVQHIIRNAIDHGIESVEQRISKGKPEIATIHFKVSHESARVRVSISDDGDGINLDAIRKKALSLGLLSKVQVNDLDEPTLLNTIFESGFSTQDEVSEISGRGVGLSAVKSDIEKMKGHLSIETKKGFGTTFHFDLPLSLATTKGLFVNASNFTFMLPSVSLTKIFEVEFDDLHWVDDLLIYVIQNKSVPVKLLSQVLGVPTKGVAKNHNYIGLYIKNDAFDFIYLVDEIVDEYECVVNNLPSPFNRLKQYMGVTLTGDGNLVMALDVNYLLDISSTIHTSITLDTKAKSKSNKAISYLKGKRVLIVDDSLTTRSLTTSALDAKGMDTISMADGKKAWDLLQTQMFDFVVTDIEMPLMNGYELTKKIKDTPSLAKIPVIIVSSTSSKKDMERGFLSGANAFLVKSEFETNKLIQQLESLI